MIASAPLRMTSLLDYLPETGLERHPGIIAGRLATMLIHVHPDNILITNGGQHGNMMALQAATRPGDTIVSESLTYSGFINAARQWQTHHIGLPMDEHGLIPEALEQCCLQLMTHHLKGMDIQAQSYSFHGWLKLPEPWRAETFVRQLQNKGVKVLQSELFAVGSCPVPQAVRLCISSPESDNNVQFALETMRDILTVELEPVYRPLVF